MRLATINGEPTRDEDECALTTLRLAADGWGLADIATAVEREIEWVIETLYEHRAAFRPESQN